MYSGTESAYFGFDGPVELGDLKETAQANFTNDDGEVTGGNLHTQVDFLFQAAFAATAATIVSGAVAGRLKFSAYIIYTMILTGVIYPISGFWKWGGGWLDQMGFYDFAGSIVVHAVGGFAGLAAAIVLGPRIGRFGKDKTSMPGHNLTFAALGVFILLIGWFGFNPGSQLAISSLGDAQAVMVIATNTTLAAAAGAVFALIFSWIVDKKPDLTMALNGILAGLVGITANCDGVSNWDAIIIGGIAGVLVVCGIKLLEIAKIDDPVGAWPVHGLCGMWGGIATGIFGDKDYWGYADEAETILYGNMGAQITGTIVIALYAFVTMFILFTILKAIGVLRVSEEDEMVGLDLSEHGQSAYGE
jgi:Amt family ammonium transporter